MSRLELLKNPCNIWSINFFFHNYSRYRNIVLVILIVLMDKKILGCIFIMVEMNRINVSLYFIVDNTNYNTTVET